MSMFLAAALLLVALINSALAQDKSTPDFSSIGKSSKEYHRLYLENKNARDYVKALEYLKQYELMRDSLNMERRNMQLQELKTRYETDQKEQEIRELEQENRMKEMMIQRNRYILSGITGLAILIVLVISLLIRQNRLKSSQQALLLEQNLLRSQMNPHFIFNALTNIQSFIVRKETDQSLKYLLSFSALIGNILETSGKKLIPLQTELSVIENYLALQKLRYGDKLNYKVIVDPSVNSLEVSIPPVMVQPLVENAIEHGIKHKEGQGNVGVRFHLAGNKLVVEVEDDGVGRVKAAELRNSDAKSHAGLATVIIQERLAGKGRMEIEDLVDAKGKGCGTISRLVLPLMEVGSRQQAVGSRQ